MKTTLTLSAEFALVLKHTPQDGAIISHTGVTTRAPRWCNDKRKVNIDSYIDVLLQHATKFVFYNKYLDIVYGKTPCPFIVMVRSY